MSKFTRSELKDLVKECLVEILFEGLTREPTSSSPPRAAQVRPKPAQIPLRASSGALNAVVFGQGSRQAPAQHQKGSDARAPRSAPAIVESVGALTSDPVMAQIFADTASTTLLEQSQADSSRQGSPSMQEAVGSPMEIFSESANNWAALAFASAPKKC